MEGRTQGEYGITYRTPLAPLCKFGHYGAFIGLTWETFAEYRDLVVRIGGYSDYFVRLSDNMQKEVILRTEHEL